MITKYNYTIYCLGRSRSPFALLFLKGINLVSASLAVYMSTIWYKLKERTVKDAGTKRKLQNLVPNLDCDSEDKITFVSGSLDAVLTRSYASPATFD